MAELLHCYNKGCCQKFDPKENPDDACKFHPGAPVFHDALKYWSCCNKKSTDFTEFLSKPGCARGKHSNEKPLVPEKPDKPSAAVSNQEIHIRAPKPPEQKLSDRPPEDEPYTKLPFTVAQSLQQALDSKLSQLTIENKDSGDSNTIEVGTSCKNNACTSSYEGEHSLEETCKYHPGCPIFHEGMKYWSCCERKTSEFDNFLSQEGCKQGKHLWFKKESEGEKKSCKFDWFQTGSNVTISVYSKLALPDKCTIEVNRVVCNVCIAFEGGQSLFERKFLLKHVIDPARSNVKMLGTKVEITLRKKDTISWATLELPPQEPVNHTTEDVDDEIIEGSDESDGF